MQFIDLKKQYSLIEEDVKLKFDDILKNTRFIMGKEVLQLEETLANYVGVKHCISCSSGTDALVIPLMAWGVGPGDAVFIPTFTFFATAEAVSLVGATPIFIDIEQDTYNIDINKLELVILKVLNEGRLNPKVIIPVDLFGTPANYKEINRISQKYNLLVLEDGAQGFGGEFYGEKACSFGHAAATSFFPAKPLGCYGDGGAVFTNDDQLADKMTSIRVHGQGSNRYENIRIGLNGRLDTLQAAVLLSKLKIFDDELVKRNEIAELYTNSLKNCLVTPKSYYGYKSCWAQYSLLADNENHRSKIIEYLNTKDIPTMIYYPIPLHRQKAYLNISTEYCDLSVSENISTRIFSIPMHPYLKEEEVSSIINEIKNIV